MIIFCEYFADVGKVNKHFNNLIWESAKIAVNKEAKENNVIHTHQNIRLLNMALRR